MRQFPLKSEQIENVTTYTYFNCPKPLTFALYVENQAPYKCTVIDCHMIQLLIWYAFLTLLWDFQHFPINIGLPLKNGSFQCVGFYPTSCSLWNSSLEKSTWDKFTRQVSPGSLLDQTIWYFLKLLLFGSRKVCCNGTGVVTVLVPYSPPFKFIIAVWSQASLLILSSNPKYCNRTSTASSATVVPTLSMNSCKEKPP